MTTSDDIDEEQNPGHKRGRRSQASRLVDYVLGSPAHLYVDSRGRPAIDPEGDAQRVVSLSGAISKQWVTGLFYEAEKRSPSDDTVRQAIRTLEAIASKDAEMVPQEIIDRMAANDAIARELRGNDDQERSQTNRLIDLATEQGIYCFHDQREEPYCVLPLERKEIWPLNSSSVRRWLTRLLWMEEGKAPSREVLNSAVNLLSSIAIFDGPEHPLDVRVVWHGGDLYYDLGDWRAVKITTTGWEVIEEPPILFRHYRHQLPQAEPQHGGDFPTALRFRCSFPQRGQ